MTHIAEEYKNFYNLEYSFFRHSKNGHIYIKDDDPQKISWLVLNFEWIRKKSYWNGFYRFKILYPSGSRSKTGSFREHEKFRVEWHDFERYLNDWSAKANSRLILSDAKEVELATWEMFFFCQHRAIRKSFNLDAIYSTLDSNNPIEDRFIYYKDMINWTQYHNYNLFETWSLNFLPKIGSYSYWLADIVQQNKTQVDNR